MDRQPPLRERPRIDPGKVHIGSGMRHFPPTSSPVNEGNQAARERRHKANTPMLICHCNLITEKEIEQMIRSLLAEDPWRLIVPATVYHALQKRGRCCGCFPNVVETIIRVTEEYHREAGVGEPESVTFLDRVRGLRGQYRSDGHEGRKKDHRAA